MKTLLASVCLTGAVCTAFAWSPVVNDIPQDPQNALQDLAAMMEAAKRFTEPGENHALLERFLGKWNTETQFFMGDQTPPPDRGTSETIWLVEGRWLKSEATGPLMGRPTQIVSIMGYDNFKMSYVLTTVSNMDTAMTSYEGDVDPKTSALLMYGTLDEYLTGEHDKMVKTVTRFLSADKIVMEIHDLAIGEDNTKVLEVTYTR